MNQSNFNFELFLANSKLSDIQSYAIIKDALETSDEIGSTLRTHLFFEQVLESWIYAACNREDFLKETKVGFHVKLQIAENLGLPPEVVDIAKRLNTIRNNIAHNLICNPNYGIDESKFEGLKDSFKNKIANNQLTWKGSNANLGVVFYNDYGEPEISINWNDKNQKQHVSLAAICALTLTHLIIQSKTL